MKVASGTGIVLWMLCGLGVQLPVCRADTGEEDGEESRSDHKTLEQRLRVVEEDMEAMVGVQDRLAERVQANRINWSGSFRSTVNNFHLRDRSQDQVLTHLELRLDGNGQPIVDPITGIPLMDPKSEAQGRNTDKWFENSWVSRLRLTMTYDITKQLRFYGTIVVFKYLNEALIHRTALDMYSSRYPRDTSMHVERAYFDWFITESLVLSIGRIAAPEGPPLELKENTERRATWGAQMVEAEMDVILLTMHLERLFKDTYLRLFYCPFTSHHDLVLSDDRFLFSDGGVEPMHVGGGFAEVTLPDLGDNLWQLGFVVIPSFTPRKLSLYHSQTDEFIKSTANVGDSLGSYGMITFMGELKDIGGIGLDVFAAYSMTILVPNNGRMIYRVPFTLPIVHPQTGPTGDMATFELPVEVGLASYEEGASTNLGHFFFTGARFSATMIPDRPTRLGLELNYGSKYHLAWSSPSDLLVNKLSTKGLTLEIYLIQELLPENLFLRLGFLRQSKDYDGMYIGPTRKVYETIHNLYLVADVHW